MPRNVHYHPEVDKLEHDDSTAPETKRVLMYGWDADNSQKVRLNVDSDGRLVKSTGELQFQNSNPTVSSTFTITKILSGTTKTKTYSFNSSDELVSISDWV